MQARGIDVEVERKAVRRINLRVRPDGTARMSVPWSVGREAAAAFLAEHAEWLERAVMRTAQRNGAEGAEGAFALWGKPAELPAGAEAAEIWRTELERALPGAVARMEAATGLHAAGWQLRDMKTRWGSCTPATGRIRINVRLAAYPPACLDYVVAHELTHLAEPSHDARFHELLRAAFPRDREAKALLRKGPLA
ncbi:MAG: M48 family metallopeptidase [Coriobacteriia bacterium]|nr:M48 family metallopeptidase [Coriobacteriia bacterium]